MENKKIDFLKKSSNKLLYFSESEFSFDDLDEKDCNFILVDDLSCVTFSTFNRIFHQDKIFVFINNFNNSTEFINLFVTKLVNYFEHINDLKRCIIYGGNDFKYKKEISSITTFVNPSFRIENDNENILYLGQSGTSGYATAAKGYICDYYLNNKNVTWKPLYYDNSKNDKQYYVDVISESCIKQVDSEYDLFILHSTPDIWRRELNIHKKIKFKKTIGYCTWETDKLPTKWIEHINRMEEVWVPSYFNKETFIESGVASKIKVVPHVWHSQKLFKKSDITLYDFFGNEIPKGKYTFYSIGEFNYRKGIEDLILLFDKLKQVRPDIQLILKLHYKQYTDKNYYECIKKIKELTDSIGKSIYIILDNLTNREMLMLHSFGDCYVSLNKGEGFGLTIFDAFNFGKDIITTKYGGPLDYITNRRQLISCDIKSVKGMKEFSDKYTEDQEWAYPNLDCAYEMMLSKVN